MTGKIKKYIDPTLHVIVKNRNRDESERIVLQSNDELKISIKEYDEQLEEIENKALQTLNPDKYKREQRALLDKAFEDVRYIWALAGTEAHFCSADDNNITLGKGFKGEKTIAFPDFIIGGGQAYLEVIRENCDPMCNPLYGIYVSKLGNPDFIRNAWTDCQGNEITEAVRFGAQVLLHIYTKDLYGQDISVALKKSNLLVGSEIIDKYPANVRIFPYKQQIDHPEKSDIKGIVAKKETGYYYIQKAVIRINISHNWGIGENEIELSPVILNSNRELRTVTPLTVKTEGYDPSPSGNGISPVKVGDPLAHMGLYHPCGYTKITATEEVKDKEDRTVVLYDQSEKIDTVSSFDIVSNLKGKKVTISLDKEPDTKECDGVGLSKGKTHRGEVLRLETLPGALDITEQDSPPSESKLKFSHREGMGSIHFDRTFGDSYQQLIVTQRTDQQLVFYPKYLYDIRDNIMAIKDLFQYFWLGRSFNPDRYSITVNTCRKTRQVVDINVYPDISWKLLLMFHEKDDKELGKKFELLSTQTYLDTAKAKFKRDKVNGQSVGDSEWAIRLEAAWNEDNSFDITESLKKTIEEKLAPIIKIYEWLMLFIDGKQNKDIVELSDTQADVAEKEQKKALAKMEKEMVGTAKQNSQASNKQEKKQAKKKTSSLQRKMDSQFPDLIRSGVSFYILEPQVSIGLSWYRDYLPHSQQKDYSNKTAVFLHGDITLAPLIGLAIKFDFLGLIARAHPIALALIAALDLAMAMIGKGSKIKLELTITGQIDVGAKGKINTLTGENTFMKKVTAEDETGTSIGGKVNFHAEASIKLIKKYRMFYLNNVVVSAKGGVEADANFTANTVIGYDESGVYLLPTFNFEGLEFKGYVEGEVGVERKENGNKKTIIDGKVEFSYKAFDDLKKIEMDKVYLNNQ